VPLLRSKHLLVQEMPLYFSMGTSLLRVAPADPRVALEHLALVLRALLCGRQVSQLLTYISTSIAVTDRRTYRHLCKACVPSPERLVRQAQPKTA
jgi:hypothetical protein